MLNCPNCGSVPIFMVDKESKTATSDCCCLGRRFLFEGYDTSYKKDLLIEWNDFVKKKIRDEEENDKNLNLILFVLFCVFMAPITYVCPSIIKFCFENN